MIMMI